MVAVAAGSFAWSIYITASSAGTAYYSTFARPGSSRSEPRSQSPRHTSAAFRADLHDEARRVQLSTNRAIAANARKQGVGFVDTLGWFCAHPRGSSTRYLCPLVVNRTVTCVDQGHISRTYGFELAPEFRLAFRRELFR
jgi:hypothetical protein